MLRSASMRLCRAGRVEVAVAEQPLEHGARVVLHRQRRRGAAPRDRVGVRAAVAGIARAGEVASFDGELQRRQLGVLAEFRRGDLIRGHARGNFRPLRPLRDHVRHESGRGARVDAGRRARRGVRGWLAAEPAQHGHPIAERLQRLERRVRTRSRRRPSPASSSASSSRSACRRPRSAASAPRRSSAAPTAPAPCCPAAAAPAPCPVRAARSAAGLPSS